MKAVVALAPGRLTVEDVELSPPGPGEVLIDIAAAGVCHSDLSFIRGVMAAEFPFIPGHEAVGTVAALGAGIEDIAVGQRAVVDMSRPCRACVRCAAGEPWLCEGCQNWILRGRLADGSPLNSLMEIGAFAQQAVVRRNTLIPIGADVPLEVASLLGCGVTTAIGGIRNAAKVQPGDTVAVIGLGGVGLAAVVGARLAGAAQIIAVDIAATKEDLARRLGATDFVVSTDKAAREVRGMTGGQGTDHAVECVGKPATARLAWQCTRRGGRATIIGVGGRDDLLTFNMLELYHFARSLVFAPMGCTDFQLLVPELAERIATGALDLAPLITNRINLPEVPDALGRLGTGGREVVIF